MNVAIIWEDVHRFVSISMEVSTVLVTMDSHLQQMDTHVKVSSPL